MLRSTVNVAVFVFEGSSGSGYGDAYALFPVGDNATSYVVQSYEPNQVDPYRSQFIIVSMENATNINIFLRIKLGMITYESNHYSNGNVMNVTLNNLQTFHVYHTHDMSGTIIQSSKPVMVFAGGDCVNIPIHYFACDTIASQLKPVQYWDTSYIIPPIYWNSNYYVRITAYYDNTTVIFPGSSNVSVTLQQGDFKDINIQASVPAVLTSNTAVSVVLLNTGNPFMLPVPGKSQFTTTPNVFPSFLYQSSGNEFYTEYVAIIVRTPYTYELLYNGRSMVVLKEYAVPYPFNQFIVLVAKLENVTTHTVSVRNNISTPAGVFVYGQAGSEAYGFVAGININHTGMYILTVTKHAQLNLLI